MKRFFKITRLFLKWLFLAIFSFYFLGILILGFYNVKSNGSYSFYWSGLEASWDSEEEFGFWLDKKLEANLNGIDGPYIVRDSIYRINKTNQLIAEPFDFSKEFQVKSKSGESFSVNLSSQYIHENLIMKAQDTIVAISDIEGNFDAFSSFLKSNQIIDDQYNWTFGKNHLVLVGDFVDRGEEVTQVLWLIYKLEMAAKNKGGSVHFVLGNHEIMNFQGNWRYNARKYRKVNEMIARSVDWEEATKFMYSEKTVLGWWLRTKPVVKKIGDFLFVHGGLSPDLLEQQLSLDTINRVTQRNWNDNLYSNPKEDIGANLLLGKTGPLWYRGLVEDYKYYDKIEENELDQILKFYNAKHIVIGHTVVKDVSSDFEGKIIRLDVKHGKAANSEDTKGILIVRDSIYAINALGNRFDLLE